MYRIPIAAALLAAGCSPYVYEEEIDRFAAATSAFTEGLSGAQAEILEEPAIQAYWAAFASPRAVVDVSQTACNRDPGEDDAAKDDDGKNAAARDSAGHNAAGEDGAPKEPCHVRVDRRSYLLDAGDAVLVADIEKLKVLGRYAEGLRAVTNAEDKAAFDAASAKLSNSAAALAGTAVPHPAAGPAAGAVVGAGTTVLGLFLDQARLAQLRSSVGAVQRNIDAVKEDLSEALDALRDRRIAELNVRLGILKAPLAEGAPALPPSARKELVVALQDTTARVAALQRADPGSLVTKLAAAHEALANALEDPEPDIVNLVETIADFADLAADFNAAFAGA